MPTRNSRAVCRLTFTGAVSPTVAYSFGWGGEYGVLIYWWSRQCAVVTFDSKGGRAPPAITRLNQRNQKKRQP